MFTSEEDVFGLVKKLAAHPAVGCTGDKVSPLIAKDTIF
jgi:hypothetical protein